jgi:hypothetical protein
MSGGWGGGPNGGETTLGQYVAALGGLLAIVAIIALIFWFGG